MFGVVVAARVDDERMPFDFVERFQPRCEYRHAGVAVAVHIQHRQVAEVGVVFPRLAVAVGFFRVPMTAGGKPQDGFAVFFARVAAGIFVDVEAVQAGSEAVQRRGEDEAVFAFADGDFARRLAAVQQLDFNGEGLCVGFGSAVVMRLGDYGGAKGEGEQGFFHGYSG